MASSCLRAIWHTETVASHMSAGTAGSIFCHCRMAVQKRLPLRLLSLMLLVLQEMLSHRPQVARPAVHSHGPCHGGQAAEQDAAEVSQALQTIRMPNLQIGALVIVCRGFCFGMCVVSTAAGQTAAVSAIAAEVPAVIANSMQCFSCLVVPMRVPASWLRQELAMGARVVALLSR